MNGNNEMNLTLDGSQTITLFFNGQRPQGAANVADCTYPSSSCLWNWSLDPRTFSTAFEIQSNTLDALGESELSNGLLGVPADGVTEHNVRFNMTITVPETAPGFWRFDFNPNIPPDGGATLARVVRNDACHWTFTAAEGDLAALSILVKPPKGKQFAHREGRYSMPFVMTYHVPESLRVITSTDHQITFKRPDPRISPSRVMSGSSRSLAAAQISASNGSRLIRSSSAAKT